MPLTNSVSGIINCDLFSQKYVSPDCFDPLQEMKCDSDDPAGTGAIPIGVNQSEWTPLNGIPPLNGWKFSWESSCRPAIVINLNLPGPYGYSFQLRAIMYPYNDTNTSTYYVKSSDFSEDFKVDAFSAVVI